MDRVTRSLIFSLSSSKNIDGSQENLINSIPEEGQEVDKRRDVWVPSPDRNAKLKVLRGEQHFEIRSHLPETSPSKLFTDNDDDYNARIRVKSHKITPAKVTELKKERRDIIKKQGQHKSLDAEDVMQIQDKNDSPKLKKNINGTSSGQTTENVDTEQINFEAARKQFVMMEKKQDSLPITPHVQSRPPRLSSRLLYKYEEFSDFAKQKDPFILEQDVKLYKNNSEITQEINSKEGNSSILLKQSFGMSFLDNGNQERPREFKIKEEKESIPNPNDETPIEREIRLSLQREASLRRERGIRHSGESKEMIEIQKYPVLLLSSETEKLKKNKDRARTSFFVQREIEKEAQREADLKNEGKITGLYDKGYTQEIDERKKLFRQTDIVSAELQKMNSKTTLKGITAADTQASIPQVVPDHTNKTIEWTVVDAPLPYSVRNNWKVVPLNMYRTRRLSADNILDVNPCEENSTTQETLQEPLFFQKQDVHIHSPESNLHLQENNAEEEKAHKIKTLEAANPAELYGTELRQSRSNLIEEEIRQTLERDRELQDQRRKNGFYRVTISNEDQQTPPSNGYSQYRSPLTENSNSWSPTPWKNIPSSFLPSYILPSVQMFTPKRYPKFVASESDPGTVKRQDNWYAGINPSDAVNSEIVESTRVNRHKSPMTLRWEAGLYANDASN